MKKIVLSASVFVMIASIIVTAGLGIYFLIGNDWSDGGLAELPDEGAKTEAELPYEQIINDSINATVAVFGGTLSPAGTFTAKAYASGFIIDSAGRMITAASVINTLYKYRVSVMGSDGVYKEYFAIKEGDAFADSKLVIMRIIGATTPFEYLEFDTVAPKYGEPCVTIGNPIGLGLMAARGMVSKPAEQHDGLECILVDSASSKGTRGAAVINRRGKVIGVVLGEYNLIENNYGDVVLNICYAATAKTVDENISEQWQKER